MFQRVGNHWHCLPKANQARKALWDAVNSHTGKRRIDEAFPNEMRASKNDHEMMIRAINGSTWQVVGSDNYDSLVGSPPVGLTFSEWALCDPSAWAYLRPILAENNGWVIFNTTPRGKNHAYRTFRAAQKEPGHFAQRLSVLETNVFTPEQLEAERRQLIGEYGPDYGQSIYDQEYLCSFEAANLGAVLGRWMVRAEAQGRIKADPIYDPDGADIEISADIGFRDTAAWWFWQPRSDGFGLVDFDADSGMEAADWIARLKKRCADRGYRLGHIWLPKDARAKTFGAKRSAMEQFLSAFGSSVVRVVPNSSVADRINAGRTIIEKCWFDETRCEDGIEALKAWHFVYDEERKEFSKEPDHDYSSHPSDAFTYGALVMRTRVKDEKPKTEAEKIQEFINSKPTLDDLWAKHEAGLRQEARI